MPHQIASNAISELQKIVPAGSTLLELGTGDGTKLWAAHYNVISIENEPQWHTGHSKLIEVPLVSCKQLALPASFWKRFPKASEWFDAEKLATELSKITYDAIIIDGPAGGAKRAAVWWFFDKLFNTSVPVLLDDVHREYEWKIAMNVAAVKGSNEIRVYLADRSEKDNNCFAVII